MKKKLAVQFNESQKTRFVVQRLRRCKHCGTYSVQASHRCSSCKRDHAYDLVQAIARKLTRRKVQSRALSLGILLCLAVLGAGTLKQLLISIGAGLVLAALLFWIQKRLGGYERAVHFQQLLQAEHGKIKADLLHDLDRIAVDIKEERLKEAYEKLRELGYFFHNDPIKRAKLACLNRMVLRNDMELELESLIPSGYDRSFVDYLRKVAQVKRSLIKKAVLDYVVTYKHAILQHEHGVEILANVAGAALRMKPYIDAYYDFILEFLEYLPKERLLRLAKLASQHRQEWEELYQRTEELVNSRYSFDPDFRGIFQRGTAG
ncbi:MAG: hypothetical protein ACM32O_18250 [Clostridia bacterium]